MDARPFAYCTYCHQHTDLGSVEVKGYSENIYGEDCVDFQCNECNHTTFGAVVRIQHGDGSLP